MGHPYSAKLTYKAMLGNFPAMRGEIYEHDVLIGTFKRGPTRAGYVPPIEHRFLSDASKYRFSDFADCLSIEETIEALL